MDSNHNQNSNEINRKVIKKNPIWKHALQEQNLCDDIAKFGSFGDDDDESKANLIKIDRGVETYKYSTHKTNEENSSNHLKLPVNTSKADTSGSQNCSIDSRDSSTIQLELDRLGSLITYDSRKSRSHIHVTENDSEPAVVNEIVRQLQEPNKEIIERCVKTMGRKRALEILYATEDIEAMGGMYTSEGHRRRSPGGVYLLLVKRDETLLSCQRKQIFIEDQIKKKKKKTAKRLRQRNQFEKAKRLLSDQVKRDRAVKPNSTSEIFDADSDLNRVDEEQLIYFDDC